jgi:hypothetical protein
LQCEYGEYGEYREYGVTVFYYNPNIVPESEYRKRLAEQKRLLRCVRGIVCLIEGEYPLQTPIHSAEDCLACYTLRLEETARTAKAGNYDCISTSLTLSSKKKASDINPILIAAAEKYGVEAIAEDWGKKGGYNRSVEICREHNLYRQCYCGCRPLP